MASLGQVVNDGLLRARGSPNRLSSRGLLWSLTRARSVLIRAGDPLVTYRIGQTEIRIPLSHNLPHFQKVFPSYSRNLGRIASLLRQEFSNLAAVDVGANVGDSVAIMRDRGPLPILAIEGDRRFFAILEQNAEALGADLYLRCAMVGEQPGAGAGGMVARGGSAHYVEGRAKGRPLSFVKLSQLIDETPELEGTKLLIKIDTDGLDEQILKSEEAFLQQRQPFLFFEYDPFHFERYHDDGFAVFESLRRAGYSDLLVYENTGELRESTGLYDEGKLKKLHQDYAEQQGQRYVDIAAFHSLDAAVFTRVEASERKLFQSAAGS